MADDFTSNSSTSGQLRAGSSLTGTINSIGDTDWVAIQLESGKSYEILMEGSGTRRGTLSDPYLRLYNSAGKSVAFNDDGGGNRNAKITVSPGASGTYYISAEAWAKVGTGTYTVSLTEKAASTGQDDYAASTATTGAIAPGGSVNGSLERVSDSDWFKVTLKKNTIYTVSMDGKTLVDPWVGILNSTGSQILAGNNDSGLGKNSQFKFRPTADGTYYIQASENGDNAVGTYTVSIQAGIKAAPVLLPYQGTHKITAGYNSHHTGFQQFAVDFDMSFGEAVLAMAPGSVVSVRDSVTDSKYTATQGTSDPSRGAGDLGNYITIQHDDGTYATYFHLKKDSIPFEVGNRVEAGQRIANVGRTGVRTGDHLHVHFGSTLNPSGQVADGRNDKASSSYFIELGDIKVTATSTGVTSQNTLISTNRSILRDQDIGSSEEAVAALALSDTAEEPVAARIAAAVGSTATAGWNEQAYLAANPDVEALVANRGLANGLTHFVQYGLQEDRSGSTWDEDFYRLANPDVAAAVDAGGYANGLEHYLASGATEGRIDGFGLQTPNDPDFHTQWSEAAYLTANPDVTAAVDSGGVLAGWYHYALYGIKQGRDGSSWDDSVYLAANPDVAAAVAAGSYASGLQHYLRYGENENRGNGFVQEKGAAGPLQSFAPVGAAGYALAATGVLDEVRSLTGSGVTTGFLVG